MIYFWKALAINRLANLPSHLCEKLDLRQLQRPRMGFNQEEPVTSPRDIAPNRSQPRNLDANLGGLPITRNIGEGDSSIRVQRRRHRAHRGIQEMVTGFDSAQVGEGHHQANGPMTAHSEVSDVVEENDAGHCLGTRGWNQKGSYHDIGTPGFINDG